MLSSGVCGWRWNPVTESLLSGLCGHLLLSLESSWKCCTVSVTEGGTHFLCSHPVRIPSDAQGAQPVPRTRRFLTLRLIFSWTQHLGGPRHVGTLSVCSFSNKWACLASQGPDWRGVPASWGPAVAIVKGVLSSFSGSSFPPRKWSLLSQGLLSGSSQARKVESPF